MAAPELPLIIEPEQLYKELGHPDLLIVDLGELPAYELQHVPGAINLTFRDIVYAEPPAMGLLPPLERLSEILSHIGLTEETHVVAYDPEGNGRASRLLWTLDVLGHRRFSLLDGGIQAWLAARLPTEEGINRPLPADYQAQIRQPEALADKQYVLDHLRNPHTTILDARSPGEYSGADKRAARAGHIPGAVNFEWITAMDQGRQLRFRGAEELRGLLEERGVTPDKEVIVHCQTHHRSAHTYMMLKHLGYPRVRGYAGSWSEWGNDPETPIENES